MLKYIYSVAFIADNYYFINRQSAGRQPVIYQRNGGTMVTVYHVVYHHLQVFFINYNNNDHYWDGAYNIMDDFFFQISSLIVCSTFTICCNRTR